MLKIFFKEVILDPFALALWGVALVIFLVYVTNLAGPAKGWLNVLSPKAELSETLIIPDTPAPRLQD